MLEDSWDSTSYEYPKKSSTQKNATTSATTTNKAGSKLTQLDSKFPPTTPLKNIKKTSSSESIDALFSPTNSASDSGTPAGKKNSSFTFDDSHGATPAKDSRDYLSNFAANSTELEDSILGELLGGPNKKALKPPSSGHASASTKSARAQHRLEPLESEDKKPFASSSLKNAPDLKGKSSSPKNKTKTATFDADKSGDFDTSIDFDDDKLPTTPHPPAPLVHQHSKSLNDMSTMGGVLHTNPSLPDPFKKMASSKHMRYNSFDDTVGEAMAAAAANDLNNSNNKGVSSVNNSYEYSNTTLPSGGVKTNKVTYAEDTKKKAEEPSDDVDLGGFMPSFLEPNRQGRRRRNLETSPARSTDYGPGSLGSMMDGGGSGMSGPPTAATRTSQLDELDFALGLSNKSAAPSVGSNTSTATIPIKKPIDPFSSVDSKLRASADLNANKFDSSSDEDDNYRLKRHNKPTFGLLNTKTTTTTSSTPASTATVNSNASATSSTTVPAVTVKKIEQLPTPSAPIVTQQQSSTLSSLSVPPVEKESSTMKPTLSRSPTGHSSSGNSVFNNPLPSSQPTTTAASGGSHTVHGPSLVSTLPSLTASTSSAASNLHLDTSHTYEDDIDELDISGIVRPSETTPHSSKSPHTKSSSRPTSAGHSKSSTTPRRDGNNSLSNSVNLDESSSSISPHHSRGGMKKSQSQRLSDSQGDSHTPRGSSALANARGMLQRSQTEHVSSNATLELNTQLNASTAASAGLIVDRDAKDKIKQMQKIIETTQAEKEQTERNMRSEIESLKSKLSFTTPINGSVGAVNVSSSSTTGYKHFLHEDSSSSSSSANVRALHDEISEHKRTISQLELEISRLKDENNIKAVKHHDEVRHLRDKYEQEIADVKLRSDIDVESVERRHKDSIAALKKLHEDEIQIYKEKTRSNEVFTQLATSMKSTTGSIKYIEEQLYAKYRQVELQREGQIEAREKLLTEMEDKARERVELAEAEGYKLKGILSHMESVVNNLRHQGSEEKERLKQEHVRLQNMQAALEAEKNAIQLRNVEELNYVKQRSKEVEIELLKLATEKQSHYEYVSNSQHKLDVDRAEFNSFVVNTKRSLETKESDLIDAEVKLKMKSDELTAEKQSFESRKAAAMKDIQSVEEMKRSLSLMKEQLDVDKEQLNVMARQYHAASEAMEEREEELLAHEKALEDRETALVEGFNHMKTAAAQLTAREREIKDGLEVMDAKKIALDKIDREVLERKIAVTSAQREYIRGGGSSSGVGYNGGNSNGAYLRLLAANNNSNVSNSVNVDYPPNPPQSDSWMNNFHQQMKHSYAAGLNSAAVKHNLPLSLTVNSNAGGEGVRSPIPKELRFAQQTLQQSRSALSRVSSNQLNIQRTLQDENDFIDLIKKNTTRSVSSVGSDVYAL